MDGVILDLATIVQHEVGDYSGPAIKAKTYAINDKEQRIYTVLIVPDPPHKFEAGIMVMARIVDNQVIIDEDTTDRPLWKELVAAGIPHEQIILAYAGEPLPENASS